LAPVAPRGFEIFVRRVAADDPAHRRIMAQTLGVVHILVAGETAEYRLPQQTDQRVATILAGARISEHLTSQRGQAERIVKLARSFSLKAAGFLASMAAASRRRGGGTSSPSDN
jgi:hypothetical protein